MKIVEVAAVTSTAPQEVPGYDVQFPVPLSESGRSEKEWREVRDAEGNEVFRVREIKPGDLPKKDEGTAVEAAVAEGSEA